MVPDKDNAVLIIKRQIPYLNPALKKIGAFILEDPSKIKFLKIRDIAKEFNVSESTVTRFVRDINFNSFQELKIALAELSADNLKEPEEEKFVYDDVSKKDTTERIIDKVVFRNIEALQETKRIINIDEIDRAVEAIEKADIIVIYGIGTSIIAAENAKMRFYRVGKRCLVYNDPAQQAISASVLTENNVVIGISNSGRTVQTVNSMKLAKKRAATTICITNYTHSPIVEYSDIKLFTATKVIPFIQESMESRIAQMLIIDILYARYAAKNFNRSIDLINESAKSLKKALYRTQ